MSEAFKIRVQSEMNDLDARIVKLKAFIYSALFSSLPLAERSRLHRQLVNMCSYRNVLAERITADFK